MFDACTGYCDNGEAIDTTLIGVDIEVVDEQVPLSDDRYGYVEDGPIDEPHRVLDEARARWRNT